MWLSVLLTTMTTVAALYLLDDDPVQVKQIKMQDQGSQPQCAQVSVGGVPIKGVVDSGLDITIWEVFRKCSTPTYIKGLPSTR